MKRAKDKYWIKSGSYTLLTRVFNVLFGFGSFYILVRTLSKEDFGAWALYISVAALVEVTRYGLIQNSFVKYASTVDEREFPKVINASLFINAVVSILAVIFLLSSGKLLGKIWSLPQLEGTIYLYSVVTVLLIPFTQFNFVQQAKLKFKGIFVSTFIRQGVFFIYVLFSVLVEYKVTLHSLIFIQIIAALTASIASYLYVREYVILSAGLDFEWVKKLAGYGKYVLGTSISSTVFNTVDQMMLGILLSSPAVALYNAALRIVNIIEIPINTLAAIVFPQSSKRNNTEGISAVKYLYEKSVGVILAFILPLLFFGLIFTREIIWLIAGEAYYEAVPVLRVIIAFSFFLPFIRQFGVILDSIGKAKINLLSITFTSLLNIITDYIFIKAFGLIGAAIGTLVAVSISFIINQIILWKVLNVNTLHTLTYMWKFYFDSFKMIKSKLLPEVLIAKEN